MGENAKRINKMEVNAGLEPTKFVGDPYMYLDMPVRMDFKEMNRDEQWLVAGEIIDVEMGRFFGVFLLKTWIDTHGNACGDWGGVPLYTAGLEKYNKENLING